MSDLFMKRSAVISPCGQYRYLLVRSWDENKPRLVVVMYNPSRADDQRDDPTMQRLLHFARQWGYGSIVVVNLRAFRASQPSEVYAAQARGVDTTGPDNGRYWREAILSAQQGGAPVLVAWGNMADSRDYEPFLAVAHGSVQLVCLGTTESGAPKHPMARGQHRIANDQQPVAWSRAQAA